MSTLRERKAQEEAHEQEIRQALVSRKKLLESGTLEVSPSQHAIVQARGPLNGALTDDEHTALRQWAGETGLRLRA